MGMASYKNHFNFNLIKTLQNIREKNQQQIRMQIKIETNIVLHEVFRFACKDAKAIMGCICSGGSSSIFFWLKLCFVVISTHPIAIKMV